jgi:CMP/dCMP kinase
MEPELRISIDGPTASGKTTLGTALARELCTAFLDTGLTFRAAAYALRSGWLASGSAWPSKMAHLPLAYQPAADGAAQVACEETVWLDSKNITNELWSVSLDSFLSTVSGTPAWRAQILAFHKAVVQTHRRIVVVGRDVATTLLSPATLSVALTASFAIRRERRRAQFRDVPGRSVAVGPATQRDLDGLKEISTLRNSIIIDTTYLPADAVVAAVVARLEDVQRGP